MYVVRSHHHNVGERHNHTHIIMSVHGCAYRYRKYKLVSQEPGISTSPNWDWHCDYGWPVGTVDVGGCRNPRRALQQILLDLFGFTTECLHLAIAKTINVK